MTTQRTEHGTQAQARTGPLQHVRVLEFAGLGPAPFACMLLADMGAEVVRIARPGAVDVERGATLRGRLDLRLDLKNPADIEVARRLAQRADVLIEGFRPGVMERLDLGPDHVLPENPALVYARMTGWGQTGPRARTAGHDLNYISLTGALDAIGPKNGAPAPPLNLVGDYGGGALYLVAGVLAALLEAKRSGQGQVVDCAICDGVVSMLSIFHRLRDEGEWQPSRSSNQLDGGAPYYGCYACQDGKYVAVGAIEPQFYAVLRQCAGLTDPLFDTPHDRDRWPEMKTAMRAIFQSKSRAEWLAIFKDSDGCLTPVLALEESTVDEHLRARDCYVELGDELQPAPAPRFARTPSTARSSSDATVEDVFAVWTPIR